MCAGLPDGRRVAAILLAVLAVANPAVALAADASGVAGGTAPIDDGRGTIDAGLGETGDGTDDGLGAPAAARCPAGPTEATRETAVAIESDPAVGPRIVEVYPNPTTHQDAGEHVVLAVPERTHFENLTLTNGHASAIVANTTVDGRVAVSTDPAAARNLTAHPVLELEGHLPLANDGGGLALRIDGDVLDRVSYDRAPTAQRWIRATLEPTAVGGGERDRGVWWPNGATCRASLTVEDATATAFVLPDSPDVAVDSLESADERILLGGYTFTDETIAEALEAALERGVEVSVLLEAGPVGGTSETTRDLLDDLEAAGADVRVLGGEGARYPYHHPKYAVVDDRALVTTENWKPSGIGGTSSRGWGVVLDDPAVAGELASVFRADAAGRDTSAWTEYRDAARFVEGEPPGEPFPEQTGPERVDVERVDVVLAPDNAEAQLRGLLRNATESIDVVQNAIGDEEHVLLEETLEAARRGVEVRILLDASWYVEEENRALTDRLERTAAREDLPLEVRLADAPDGFEKLHAKGVLVDGESAVVGSVNWNDNSLRENREVALVLHGEAAASYYRTVFESDWTGETWSLPLELLLLAVLAVALAALAGARRIEFEPTIPTVESTPSVGFPGTGGEDGRAPPADGEPSADPAARRGQPTTGVTPGDAATESDLDAADRWRGVDERARSTATSRGRPVETQRSAVEPASGRRKADSSRPAPQLSSRWLEARGLEPIDASGDEGNADGENAEEEEEDDCGGDETG